jgi:hypothetical protein
MNTNNLKNANQNLLCLFFGHKLTLKRKITNHFEEYECKVCHLELTNDDKGHKTHLTSKLREVNETLFLLHLKRHHHSL